MDLEEFNTTSDLIQDFGAEKSLNVEEAVRIAWNNYRKLENEFFKENQELHSYFSNPNYWYKLILFLHYHIFNGVYTNNGSFRKNIDPNYGKVSFGKQSNREIKMQFDGTIPNEIEAKIEDICIKFTNNQIESKLDRVIRFYQQFVKIHPFYDGNGRVGRIITNHFLIQQSGESLNWADFDSKRSFIKKLNYAHKSDNIEPLVKYCSKYLFQYIGNEDF